MDQAKVQLVSLPPLSPEDLQEYSSLVEYYSIKDEAEYFLLTESEASCHGEESG